jgi:hypothetical protein
MGARDGSVETLGKRKNSNKNSSSLERCDIGATYAQSGGEAIRPASLNGLSVKIPFILD